MPQDPDVEGAVGEAPRLGRGAERVQVQHGVGAALAEGADERGHRAGPEFAGDARTQGAGVRGPRGQAVDALHAGQDLTGLVEQVASRFGQPDVAAGPVDEPYAQFALQALQALAELRLRHAEALRGTAEMQFLGHRDEARQVRDQVHNQQR